MNSRPLKHVQKTILHLLSLPRDDFELAKTAWTAQYFPYPIHFKRNLKFSSANDYCKPVKVILKLGKTGLMSFLEFPLILYQNIK